MLQIFSFITLFTNTISLSLFFPSNTHKEEIFSLWPNLQTSGLFFFFVIVFSIWHYGMCKTGSVCTNLLLLFFLILKYFWELPFFSSLSLLKNVSTVARMLWRKLWKLKNVCLVLVMYIEIIRNYSKVFLRFLVFFL